MSGEARPDVERIARLYSEALEVDEVPWPPMSGSYASRAHEVFYSVPSLLAALKNAERERERELLRRALEGVVQLLGNGFGPASFSDEGTVFYPMAEARELAREALQESAPQGAEAGE